MASGVETEKGLAAAFFTAPVQAVLATRALKAAPGDLFLRTGSGRAKKDTSPRHIVNAAIAMRTGNPKDAVANALAFGALVADKPKAEIRKTELSKSDGTFLSETIETLEMREDAMSFPKNQSFLDAMVVVLLQLANLLKTHDLTLGMSPLHPSKSDIEVWLTTRPYRHATIAYRVSDETIIKRPFKSAQPQEVKFLDGFSEYGCASYEVIGWPALVAMARLVHLEQDQESSPSFNPLWAESGAGDTETSAAQKTEAVEAPPSTASDSLSPPASQQPNQQQASQHSEHPTYSLSLSPREGVGMLGVSAGLQEVNLLLNIGNHPNEHSYPYPASASLA